MAVDEFDLGSIRSVHCESVGLKTSRWGVVLLCVVGFLLRETISLSTVRE